jgi:hypothetical protein
VEFRGESAITDWCDSDSAAGARMEMKGDECAGFDYVKMGEVVCNPVRRCLSEKGEKWPSILVIVPSLQELD